MYCANGDSCVWGFDRQICLSVQLAQGSGLDSASAAYQSLLENNHRSEDRAQRGRRPAALLNLLAGSHRDIRHLLAVAMALTLNAYLSHPSGCQHGCSTCTAYHTGGCEQPSRAARSRVEFRRNWRNEAFCSYTIPQTSTIPPRSNGWGRCGRISGSPLPQSGRGAGGGDYPRTFTCQTMICASCSSIVAMRAPSGDQTRASMSP